jgi:hypothetical protein
MMTKEEAAEIILGGEIWVDDISYTIEQKYPTILRTCRRWIQANLLLNTMSYREAVETRHKAVDTQRDDYWPVHQLQLADEVLANLYLEHGHDDVGRDEAKRRMFSLISNTPNVVYDLLDELEAHE